MPKFNFVLVSSENTTSCSQVISILARANLLFVEMEREEGRRIEVVELEWLLALR
jgi:hypothetical protein